MQTVRDSEELTRSLVELRQAGTIALVPTLGALHAGHLALVEEAKRRADAVIATIFVNPTQFNDPDDLARYPRTEVEDAYAQFRDFFEYAPAAYVITAPDTRVRYANHAACSQLRRPPRGC